VYQASTTHSQLYSSSMKEKTVQPPQIELVRAGLDKLLNKLY